MTKRSAEQERTHAERVVGISAILGVECPTCGEHGGDPCITEKGNRRRFHVERCHVALDAHYDELDDHARQGN